MEKKRENYLLLGFMIHTLSRYHQGIGSKTVELCEMLINENNKTFGKSYAEAREKTMISMSTVHKVFHVFIKIGIIKRDHLGDFYFDKNKALAIISENKVITE